MAEDPSHSPQTEPKIDWREKIRTAFIAKAKSAKFPTKIPKMQDLEPMAMLEWATATFQRQDANLYGKLATILLCTWFLADLTAMVAGKYIPEAPANRMIHSGSNKRAKSVEDYNVIFARNIFNSKGVIPGDESVGTGTPGTPDLGGAPVRTTLPFNLIGTMILLDELRSIATIEDKSASLVYPVRIQDEIPGKARIVKIEPRRVIIVNTSSGRREFVDLPEDAVGNAVITLGSRNSGGPGIEKVAPNQFNISRSEVDKTLADLNNVLTQARAVPNFENGVPAGYKLFQIVPGSIYDKLGLVNGDVIAGLNGQPITDPGKAFEMLSELKTSNHLTLDVKRDGKPINNSYDIH